MDENAARAILEYHDATKHSFDSVHRGQHRLDWDTMPRPFKVYVDLPALPLPRDFTSSTCPALAAVADPGAATGAGPVLDRGLLAHLLYFTAGVLRRRSFPGGEVFFRAAACTGALHHVDLYVACADLADLEAGVYHFGPHDFALRRLRRGDHRGALVDATGGESAVREAPVVLVCTSTFWRNSWKYRDRAYRHVFWDGGTLLANLLALAAARGLSARVVHGFVDHAVDELLDLDADREASFALVALGRGHPAAPPPPIEPLRLETLPVSSREVDYPLIRAAHAATSFATPHEATAWRDAPPPAPRTLPSPSVPLPAVDVERAVREPIERIIVRRGSARAFSPTPIALDELAALLWCSTRGIPTDRQAAGGALAAPYLIVRAVQGLEPGAYLYDRERHGLVTLRRGEFARDAGYLALGQSFASEAAVDAFWLADLNAVTGTLGSRAYRAASLEAGIEGGKAYLAAYAQRLGATGLTFFDDDVVSFFSPPGAGTGVMFLVAAGRTRR